MSVPVLLESAETAYSSESSSSSSADTVCGAASSDSENVVTLVSTPSSAALAEVTVKVRHGLVQSEKSTTAEVPPAV